MALIGGLEGYYINRMSVTRGIKKDADEVRAPGAAEVWSPLPLQERHSGLGSICTIILYIYIYRIVLLKKHIHV